MMEKTKKPRPRRRLPEAVATLGWRAGSPGYAYLEDLRSLPGEAGLMYRLVYGASEEEWDKMLEHELVDEIAQYPHKFVTKLRPPRRRKH